MGKIRAVTLGDEEQEHEQKRRADARRQTKMSKKGKVEGVGLHGGERTSIVEGTDIKPEYKKLIDEVESNESAGEKKAKKAKKAANEAAKRHTRSKKYTDVAKMVEKNKFYPLADAVRLVKQTSFTKFNGTVELHVNLNPVALGDRKDFRGTANLPHGTGKTVRVVVADEKIIMDIQDGKFDFDVLVATPSMMPKLAKVARVLGPKGLMPNPKNGTVTEDVDKKIKELTAGQVNFKTEPDNPIVHFSVGKVSFEDTQLIENINVAIAAIGKGKIAKATITSTMGPGIKLSL